MTPRKNERAAVDAHRSLFGHCQRPASPAVMPDGEPLPHPLSPRFYRSTKPLSVKSCARMSLPLNLCMSR